MLEDRVLVYTDIYGVRILEKGGRAVVSSTKISQEGYEYALFVSRKGLTNTEYYEFNDFYTHLYDYEGDFELIKE